MDELRRHMRSLILLTFTGIASALSQGDKNPAPPSVNGLTEDAWALQFSIQSNFSLSDFQGGLLSAKYHLSPDKAIRIGLAAYFNASDYTGLNSAIYDTSRTSSSTNGGGGAQDFDLRMQYVMYPEPTADVNAFFGIGPLVGFYHSSGERQELATPSSSAYTSADRTTTWSAGLSALAGVEWFAWRKISLHAEYGASIRYLWSKQHRESSNSSPSSTVVVRNTSDYKEKGWAFYYDRFYFGLSVYF